MDPNEKLENEILWAYYGIGTMPAPKTSIHDLSVPGSADTGATANSGSDSTYIPTIPLDGNSLDN